MTISLPSIRTVGRRLQRLWRSKAQDWGDFDRLTPFSRHFGYDRGEPIDRYYIAQFLQQHAADVRGRVLEIGDAGYTEQFGGERVTYSDVLHIAPGNPAATILGDLTQADHIADDTFDCFILTQTLHLLFDVPAGVATVHRILQPGGVVLATVPGLSQPSADQWAANWYWSLSAEIMRQMFVAQFGAENVTVRTYGNRQAATAFLYGLARHEVAQRELDAHDPACELLVTVRAVKQERG